MTHPKQAEGVQAASGGLITDVATLYVDPRGILTFVPVTHNYVLPALRAAIADARKR